MRGDHIDVFGADVAAVKIEVDHPLRGQLALGACGAAGGAGLPVRIDGGDPACARAARAAAVARGGRISVARRLVLATGGKHHHRQ